MADIWEERRKYEGRRPDDFRDPYQRDFARLVHCAAFRRLQGKTQVLGLGDSDFYRTRLTHSMEVAQVGSGITSTIKKKKARNKKWLSELLGAIKLSALLPTEHLISAIGLAHDLGHPPFGHGGEIALNYCMLDHGGFEGNGQTLRILSKLEKYRLDYGLNPTRRLLFGILKYPLPYSYVKDIDPEKYEGQKGVDDTWLIAKKEFIPPKCYLDSEKQVVDWVLDPFCYYNRCKLCYMGPFSPDPFPKDKKIIYYHGLDTSIMELADDICYAVHDLEDAITLKLISEKEFDDIITKYDPDKSIRQKTESAISRERMQGKTFPPLKDLKKDIFSDDTCKRKSAVGGLVHMFVSHCTLERIEGFTHPLLAFNAAIEDPFKDYLEVLKKVFRELVIASPSVQQLELKGQRIVIELFKIFNADPERLLPDSTMKQYKKASGEEDQKRILCDYISGMTDEYAGKLYERFLLPRHGSVFDRL